MSAYPEERRRRADRGAGRQRRRHVATSLFDSRHEGARRPSNAAGRRRARAGARRPAEPVERSTAEPSAPRRRTDPDGQQARRHHLGGDRLQASAGARCSSGARPTRARTRATTRRSAASWSRRSGTSASRRRSSASSAARTSPATSCAWRRAPRSRRSPSSANDLAYALASTDIRILAPIPGKQAVGVEVPNQRRRLVRLGDIYAGRPQRASPLVAWLGKDIAGNAGLDRPREDAARAGRRHHRLGQVRLRQRDPLLDPAARLARTRCAWSWSTRSGSSSTTTSRSRTC